MRYLAVVILLAAAIAIAAAQDLGPPPYTDSTSVAFEVASVKPEQDRRTWRVVRDAARSVHGVEHPAQSTDPRTRISSHSFKSSEDQTGSARTALKLESTRGPVELLVIDSAEQPAEN